MKRALIFKLILPGIILLTVSYLSFMFIRSCSWVIVFLTFFAISVYLGISFKKAPFKFISFNIAAVFLALFLFESYLFLSKDVKKYGQISGSIADGNYFAPNNYLGFGVNKDTVFTSKKTLVNKVIFDVSYTIKNRIRYTPNSNEDSRNSVLFFGCSNTYGEGIQDTSTLPFYFNRFAGGKYKVFNYAFPGYGPQQMLANIENRVNKDMEGCNGSKIAFYCFIADHVARAAGYRDCNRNGPRYEVIDGRLQNKGFFKRSRLQIIIEDILDQSYTYLRMFPLKKPNHKDFIRTIEIIRKSKELLNSMGIKFYVFIWETDCSNQFKEKNDYIFFQDELKKSNIPMLFVKDAIPDYDNNFDNYTIPIDKHPNDLCNMKIGQYLYQQIKDTL